MFKNPLKKYQQGGSTPTEEQQKLLAAFIEWLPKRVKEFQGMQPEAIAQALDGMSKTPEGQKQVQQLMEQFQQEMESGTQAFKQGGKIHDFICKHAKGGVTDCGCSRKMENGGPTSNLNFIERMYDGDGNAVYIMARERRHLPSNMRSDPNSEYQQQGGEYQGNGQVSIVDFGNGKLRINSDPYGPYGNVLHGADSAAYANRALELMKKIGMKPSTGFVQSNQEGGELTRKEALRLGRKNKGYNRAQARLAYQNAKNSIRSQGGKGREMRQTARQWVAGQNEAPYYLTPAQKDIYNEVNYGTGTVMSQPLSQGPNIAVPSVVSTRLIGERPSDVMTGLDNMPFSQAFTEARRRGARLFRWGDSKWPFTTERDADQKTVTLKTKNTKPERQVLSEPQPELIEVLYPNYNQIPPPKQLYRIDQTFSDPRFENRLTAETDKERNPIYFGRGIKHKQGGTVKAQNGAIITEYSNPNPINEWIRKKINNNSNLYHLSQSFQNFKNSAPGKVLDFFTSNLNSESGMLGAIAPVGKVKHIPEGKIGSVRRANYDPFVWEVLANDPVAIENAKELGIKIGSKEWAKYLEDISKHLDDLMR